MGKIKKVVLTAMMAVAGLLLTLAGVDLIQLSQSLILYAGILLLMVAAAYYFLN